MPIVQIQRSRSNLSSTSGLSSGPRLSADPNVGRGQLALGEQFQQAAEERRRQEKLSEDSTYVATASVQVQRDITALREQKKQEFAGNPKGYTDSLAQDADLLYAGVLENAPSPEAKRALQSQLAGFARSDFAQAYAWEKKATVDSYLSNHQQSMNVLQNQLFDNPQDAENIFKQADALHDAAGTYLDPSQKSRLTEGDYRNLQEALFKGTLEKDTDAAKALLETEEFERNFSSDQLQQLDSLVERKVRSNELKQEKEANQIKEQAKDDILLNIFRAETPEDIIRTEAELVSLLDEEVFSGGEFVSLAERLEKKAKAIEDKEVDVQSVQLALDNNVSLNPANKDDVKAVDNYYKEIYSPQINAIEDTNLRIQKMAEFVDKTNIVPAEMRETIGAELASGSPNRQLIAADLMMEITDRNPAILSQFKQEATFAQKIVEGRNAGLSPEAAVDAAQVQVFEKGTEHYKRRVKQFDDEKKTFDESAIKTILPFDDPQEVPIGMQNDWELLYRRFYVDDQMSEKSARDLAYKTLQTQWGRSTVTGKTKWMKNAPELVYGRPNGDNDWMRRDLVATVVPRVSFGDKKDMQKFFDNLTIIQAPSTTASSQPAYHIFYQNSLGALEPVPSSRNVAEPLMWRPSYEDSPDYKELQQRKEESRERIKAMTPDMKLMRVRREEQKRLLSELTGVAQAKRVADELQEFFESN